MRGDQTIYTYGGLLFDYTDPCPEQVSIEDIALNLSQTCRFGGGIRHFYSVAQHALLVRELVRERGYAELGYAALHHDSHEAYIGDIPTPLKRALGEAYREVQGRVDLAVGQHLGINPDEFDHPIIKQADHDAMMLEAAALKPDKGRGFAAACDEDPVKPRPGVGECFPPESVREVFLLAHRQELGEGFLRP